MTLHGAGAGLKTSRDHGKCVSMVTGEDFHAIGLGLQMQFETKKLVQIDNATHSSPQGPID
jgi:hypothetical protein